MKIEAGYNEAPKAASTPPLGQRRGKVRKEQATAAG